MVGAGGFAPDLSSGPGLFTLLLYVAFLPTRVRPRQP